VALSRLLGKAGKDGVDRAIVRKDHVLSWRNLPGWFNFQGFYREVVEQAPVGATLVEIGSAFGRSTAFLARDAIDKKRDDLRIVAVDPFRWQVALGDCVCDTYRRALAGQHLPFVTMLRGFAIHAPQELERIDLLRLPSIEASRLFDRVHLAMIDGDHAYGPVKADIVAWREKATILAGHDFDLEGVSRAVRELLPKFTVRVAEKLSDEDRAGDFLPADASMGAVWVRE
jgi:hypothetical protein